MSRFVINNKVYDTEKMGHIGTVKKWYRNDFVSIFTGKELGKVQSCELYRSVKGNYLLTYKDAGHIYGEAINENEAKNLLMHHDYNNYRKLFGDLEEA